jgi:hypothetical protein
MSLLDEIHKLQTGMNRPDDSHPVDRYERMAINLAASLLELIHEERTGKPPDVVTLWTAEDYEDLPDVFEMWDSRILPKRWSFYAITKKNEKG